MLQILARGYQFSKAGFPSSTSKIRSPIDLSLFKSPQGTATIHRSLEARFAQNPAQIITQVKSLIQDHRKCKNTVLQNLVKFDLEMSNKRINDITSIIRDSMKKLKNDDEVEQLKSQIKRVKQDQEEKKRMVKVVHNRLEKELKLIGNIVEEQVMVSKDEKDNVVITSYYPQGYKQKSKAKSYHQICQLLQLVDQKRGQKVSGHRGYFLKGQSVKLALALSQYGLSFLQSRKHTLYQTPTLMLQHLLQSCCQLSTIQQDMYKLINQPNSYLIATSQQPLASLYQGQVLDHRTFPIKLAGYSSCYRKQAGAHGKDIQGIFRVHQFQKVQQFIICEPENSKTELEGMLKNCEQFYRSLKIPYRVVRIVSGELNDAASIKYDLQGWYPTQQKYKQLVSISNCTDYQSRMLDLQYLSSGSQYRYPHMLNGTLIAIQRAITCFLQNWQEDSEAIIIPDALRDYYRFDKIPFPK